MLDQFPLGLRTAMVALQLDAGADPSQVADEVTNSIGNGVTTVDPRAAAGSPLAEVQPLLLLVTVLSLVVGAGSTANSVALAASERRRETGLLRAAGASSQQVFRVFMLEVLLLTAAAIPVGIAAGIGLAALLEAHLTPADLPVPSLDVNALQVLFAVLVGAAAALLGGAIPALASGRHPILAGLRPHPGSERERIGTFPISLAPIALLAGAVLFIVGDGAAAAFGTVLVIAGVLCALPLLAPWAARLVGFIASAFTSKSGAGDTQPGAPAQPHRADPQRTHHRRRQRLRGERPGLGRDLRRQRLGDAPLLGRRRGAQPGGADLRGRGEHRRVARCARRAAVALPLGGQRQQRARGHHHRHAVVRRPAAASTSPRPRAPTRSAPSTTGRRCWRPSGFAAAHGWLVGSSVPAGHQPRHRARSSSPASSTTPSPRATARSR